MQAMKTVVWGMALQTVLAALGRSAGGGRTLAFGYRGTLVWLRVRGWRRRRVARASRRGGALTARPGGRPASGQAQDGPVVAETCAARSDTRPPATRRRVPAETLEP